MRLRVIDVERAQHGAIAAQNRRDAAGGNPHRRRECAVVFKARIGGDVLADHLQAAMGRARARRASGPDRRILEVTAVIARQMRGRRELQGLMLLIQHHHCAIQRCFAARFHAQRDGIEHHRQWRTGRDQAQDRAVGCGGIFDPLAVGNIGQRTDVAQEAPVAAEVRRRGVDTPAVLPIVAADAVFGDERAACIERLLEGMPYTRRIIGMHRIPPALVQGLFLALAGELIPLRVPVDAVAVHVRHPDHRRHRLAQCAEARLAFAQLVLEPAAVVDIGVGADPLADASMFVADGQGTRQVPAGLPIVAAQLAFDLVGALAIERQRPRLAGHAQACGRMCLLPRGAGLRVRVQAGVFVPALIEIVRLACRIGDEDDLRHRVGQPPQPRLAGRQLALRLGPLHRFPAPCHHQPHQFDVGGGPLPRCTLMHADCRHQLAMLVQRNRQRRAQAGMPVLLDYVVRRAGGHRVGGEPGAVFQQRIAQPLRGFQRKISLEARHVLHVVADHVHHTVVLRRQAECAAVDPQMLAEQAHAGVHDRARFGDMLQGIFQMQ